MGQRGCTQIIFGMEFGQKSDNEKRLQMASSTWSSRRAQGIKLSEIREVFAKVEAAKRKGISVTNFSIGRPDFDTPDHIKQAAKEALDRGLVHYTTSAGILSLREAVCNRLKKDFDLPVDPEEVIITSGATEAIYIALQSILNPGDEILVPEPMYVYYTGWSFLGEAACVTIPLDEKDPSWPARPGHGGPAS